MEEDQAAIDALRNRGISEYLKKERWEPTYRTLGALKDREK